jgi:hypothetical protein
MFPCLPVRGTAGCRATCTRWKPTGPRGGKDTKTGEDTRPYRFGEFDILAVSMHPSTRDWGIFMYTVADWLLPRPGDKQLMLKFQPVGKIPDDRWTANLEEAIA